LGRIVSISISRCFGVRTKLDAADGKILSVELRNPVVFIVRECEDAALAKCGASKPAALTRDVNLKLMR
jgi:hypothetical protein